MKILHTARYLRLPWEILKSVVPDGFTVETLDELSYDCLLRQEVDADYLLVSGRLPIDEGVLSIAKHLKMIQRTGVSTEMLDVDVIKSTWYPGVCQRRSECPKCSRAYVNTDTCLFETTAADQPADTSRRLEEAASWCDHP